MCRFMSELPEGALFTHSSLTQRRVGQGHSGSGATSRPLWWNVGQKDLDEISKLFIHSSIHQTVHQFVHPFSHLCLSIHQVRFLGWPGGLSVWLYSPKTCTRVRSSVPQSTMEVGERPTTNSVKKKKTPSCNSGWVSSSPETNQGSGKTDNRYIKTTASPKNQVESESSCSVEFWKRTKSVQTWVQCCRRL